MRRRLVALLYETAPVGLPMLMCVEFVPELDHLAIRIEMPDMDLVIFDNPSASSLHCQVDVDENHHNISALKKGLRLELMKFQSAERLEKLLHFVSTAPFLKPGHIVRCNRIFPFDVLVQVNEDGRNIVLLKGGIDLLDSFDVSQDFAPFCQTMVPGGTPGTVKTRRHCKLLFKKEKVAADKDQLKGETREREASA